MNWFDDLPVPMKIAIVIIAFIAAAILLAVVGAALG